jgi:hypothetical protein
LKRYHPEYISFDDVGAVEHQQQIGSMEGVIEGLMQLGMEFVVPIEEVGFRITLFRVKIYCRIHRNVIKVTTNHKKIIPLGGFELIPHFWVLNCPQFFSFVPSSFAVCKVLALHLPTQFNWPNC